MPLRWSAWLRFGNLTCLQLYSEVHIPEAVWQEVVVDGAGQPGSTEVENAEWIKRHQVSDTRLVHSLLQYLDEGESEAIALAVELKAELLIIDERLGRDTARHFGLNFTGLIGLLVVSPLGVVALFSSGGIARSRP